MIRSNFSIGLYSFCLLQRLDKDEIPSTDRVIIGEDGLYCVPRNKNLPDSVGDYYEAGFKGSPDLNIDKAAMEFAKMLLRNFTLDSFESIKSYCRETDKLDQLYSQPWYQFTRMIRNSLTHTQTWHFRDYDREKLPVSWRDKTISIDMEGEEPNFDFFGWWDGCELWEEINQFAQSLD